MKTFTRLFVLIATATVMAAAQTAVAPSAGDGSKEHPYLISSLENLYWIAADDYSTMPGPTQAERWAAHYRQTTNINATATSSWSGGWTPIGNTAVFFSGSYDGDSFAIDSLFIDRNENEQGVFGAYNGADTIKNLAVTNVSITSPSGSNTGAVVGYIYLGNIIDCSSSGTITANWSAGGVIGAIEATAKVRNCSSSCTVIGNENVGGLLGMGQYVSMEFCNASGSVSGYNNVGGLIGLIGGYSNIISCYAAGSATGTNENAGGLIGNVYYSNILKSYSRAVVQGKWVVGGLVGKNNIEGFIENCYSHSVVHGVSGIGGLVGENEYAFVIRCYSSGPATGEAYVGGIAGNDKWGVSIVDISFWNTDSSGLSTSVGGTGLTESQMKIQSIFTDNGWDFENIWEMVPGFYPRLRGVPDAALPVELIAFTATVKHGGVELKWKTATEVNNYGFEIERKAIDNGQLTINNWSNIGFAEGNGTNNALKEYSFTEKNISAGKYSYRLKQIDRDGKFAYSNAVEVAISQIPQMYALMQNYPNPFNPVTMINYQIPMNSSVSLKVYDAIGREVATLVNEVKEAGRYSATFDGSKLSSGMYFYSIRAGSFTATKKLMLMK